MSSLCAHSFSYHTYFKDICRNCISNVFKNSLGSKGHEEIINEINIELGHADLYACKVPIYIYCFLHNLKKITSHQIFSNTYAVPVKEYSGMYSNSGGYSCLL